MSTITVEDNDDQRYELRAHRVRAAGGEVELNEHGCYRSVHHCATCGQRFTVCPPSLWYPDCLIAPCPSYDPARDATVFFGPDDPSLIEER